MTFSLIGPSWLVIDQGSGALSGTPLNDHVGGNDFTLEVSDGNGGTASHSLTITVTNTNDAPTIGGIPPDATEDSSYSFALTGNDVDVNDTLTFSLVGNPSWITIDSNTGVISGIPANGNVTDSVTFTAKVQDNSGDTGNDTATVDVTMAVINTNDPPLVATPIPDQNIIPGAFPFNINLSNYFSDIDTGDSLSFSITANSDSSTVATIISGPTLSLSLGNNTSLAVTITVEASESYDRKLCSGVR